MPPSSWMTAGGTVNLWEMLRSATSGPPTATGGRCDLAKLPTLGQQCRYSLSTQAGEEVFAPDQFQCVVEAPSGLGSFRVDQENAHGGLLPRARSCCCDPESGMPWHQSMKSSPWMGS